MIVAVIDDGVNPGRFPEVGKPVFDLRALPNGKLVRRVKKQPDSRSHGTTCAAIIQKYAPNAEIGSIKVIQDDSLRGEPRQMLTALRWCAEQRIPLIHMSIGSERLSDVPPIREAVREAQESGCVVVAAQSNSGRFTAPACLDGVIGVRTSGILTGEQYDPIEGGLFEVPFAASSRHELTSCDGETRTTSLCNSFAAPLITAKVYGLLEKEPGLSGTDCIQRLGGRVPDIREQFRQTPFLGRPLEAPVLWVIGRPGETVPILIRLRAAYAEYGISCVLFSDGNAVDGVVLLPKEGHDQRFFSYLEHRMRADIFLVASPEDSNIADGRIYVHSGLKNTRYRGKDIYMPSGVSNRVLGRIMDHIEKQFSCYG